jgi:Protein of unknwon function (DUF3310)
METGDIRCNGGRGPDLVRNPDSTWGGRMDQNERSDPNDRQIDGEHYRAANKDYQHWDLVADYGLSYFIGNMTKYVCRWRKKHGLTDLEKALHYLDKLISLELSYRFIPKRKLYLPTDTAGKFCEQQGLGELETEIVILSVRYREQQDLPPIREKIMELIRIAKEEERNKVESKLAKKNL